MQSIESKDIVTEIYKNQYKYDFSFKKVIGNLVYDTKRQINLTITAKNSVFEGEIIFICNEANTNLVFDGSNFKKKVRIDVRGRTQLSFISAVFQDGIEISGNENCSLEFDQATVTGNISIENCNLEYVNFTGFSFNEQSNDNKFLFRNNHVKKKSIFQGAQLVNARFNETIFDNIANFDGVKFYYSNLPGNGNFFNVKFLADTFFNAVEFDKGAFFNGAEFHGSAMFIGLNEKNNCVGNFSGASFHKRVFFDKSKFKKVTFNNCEFMDIVSFKNVECDDLKVSKAIFLKGADFLDSDIKNGDRETFRIIKNEFLKINNQVEALHYRAKEMLSYEKELRFRLAPWEYILLFLNKVSNNHGLSWARALLFTLLTGVFFFSLYLISLESLPFRWGWVSWQSFYSAVGELVKYFVRFFIVTHDLDFMHTFTPSASSFVIDFVSKIFISYGIYQTIQAFRKYGKG